MAQASDKQKKYSESVAAGTPPNDAFKEAFVAEPLKTGVEATTKYAVNLPALKSATETMDGMEGAGGYTPQKDWGAFALKDAPVPFFRDIARSWGGPDFRKYLTAQAQFEALILPIFAGTNQSKQESLRQIRAGFAELSDDTESLRQKAQYRRQLVKAAETILGGQPYSTEGVIQGAEEDLSVARGETGGLSEEEKRLMAELEKEFGEQ
jgi:hypothetical protein